MKIRRVLNNVLIKKRTIVTDFKTLAEMQQKSCLKHSERPLFGTNQPNVKWTTYKQWNDSIKIFRNYLHSINVNKNDKISIISNNKIEWSVAAYSSYSLGAVFVPMYQNQRIEDWKYILNDSKSKILIITDKNIYQKCKDLYKEIDSLEKIIYFNNNYQNFITNNKPILEFPDENDLASLIYTSGTTGNPKGVEITHKNLVSNIKGIQNSFTDFSKVCNEKDRSISFLPWAHCYGQTCELHGSISSGSSLYLSDGVDKLVEEIEIVKPTLLFSVPALFNRIYDNINQKFSKNKLLQNILDDALNTSRRVKFEKSNKLDKIKYNFYEKIIFSKIRNKLGGKLRHSFVGGAATPLKVIEFFELINVPIIEGYGLTETSPIITLGSLDYPDRKLGSVGKPLPNNDVIIMKKDIIQPVNQEGEIVTSGPNVMSRYHNIDSDTFVNINNISYFKTGDIGYLDEKNRLFITGRLKEQYKLENGKFVIPSLLENYYNTIPSINQILVYGDNKPYNIAIIFPNNENHNYLEEIEIFSKINNIKMYEVPKKVLVIKEPFTFENGLLTPKMSIKRDKVFEKYKDDIYSLYK